MDEIKALFLHENDQQCLLHCPYCGGEFVRLNRFLTFSGGKEGYDAARVFDLGVRGEVDVLLFEGECGHRWALAFGFHKGVTFYKVVRDLREPEADE